MKKILIIEDDEAIRYELKTFLNRYNYNALIIDDFANVVKKIEEENADLILLDINLPIYDGFYICREIRKSSNTPIIVVTSRDSDIDELMSMNLGADDFITKPYNTQILLARINAILKRVYSKVDLETIRYKDLILNLSSGTISYEENILDLTKNEIKILSYMMKNKGKIISRENLMSYLWNSDFFVDDNTLSVNITRLRKKIESIGLKNPIETRRGLGYIMP